VPEAGGVRSPISVGAVGKVRWVWCFVGDVEVSRPTGLVAGVLCGFGVPGVRLGGLAGGA